MRSLLFAFSCLSACSFAQYTGLYRDGIDVSRGPMPLEKPLGANIQADPPSTLPAFGPVRGVAEYEPMDGIIMAWEGSSGQNSILAQMAKEITSADGDAKVYMFVDSLTEQGTVTTALSNAGANMSRVQFVVKVTDSIWCRDYGPRYIYQGDCRAIVKHTYNRNRPNDNIMPFEFSSVKGHQLYQIPLIHGGGNYHLDGVGRGWSTRLIANENPTKSETQIRQLWQDYQNVDTTLTDPFPTSVDSTQHIDMWMQIIGDNKVVVSDWPNEPGSIQDSICDSTASTMSVLGYQVFRIPAFRSGGTHYTYTNVVLCNGVAIVPSFTVGTFNAQALAVWQSALPGKRIVQLNCQALVTSAGVVHCVVMHVPRFLGGSGPISYMASPNGAEQFRPGDTVTVKWAADDDVAPTSIELRLSLDGGASFPTVLASQLAPNGEYQWTVPDMYSTNAKLRVTVRDAENNQSSDDSDAPFMILGTETPPLSDLNVSRGTVLNGGLANLATADQDYLQIERHNPLLPDPFNRPQIEFVCGSVSNVTQPTSLEVTVSSKSVVTTSATLSLKNWQTGQFDTIAQYTVGTTDFAKTVSGIGATPYVRADGRIETRIGNRQAAPYFNIYRSSFDWVQVKVSP